MTTLHHCRFEVTGRDLSALEAEARRILLAYGIPEDRIGTLNIDARPAISSFFDGPILWAGEVVWSGVPA